jgi:hypothetical protein
MSVVIPVAVSAGASGAWAYNGNGACLHDNGSDNSAGCVVEVVSTAITSQAVLAGYYGLGHWQDQLRWHTSVYGGPAAQYAESGLIEYGTSAGNNAWLDMYIAWVNQQGTPTLRLAYNTSSCPANWSGVQFDQTVLYSGPGTWSLGTVDASNTSCGLSGSTGNVQIDGAAAAEAGLAFVPYAGGYLGDGTVDPYNYNATAQINPLSGGVINSNNYINDAPCGGAPCLNGAFYSGTAGWSTNLQ